MNNDAFLSDFRRMSEIGATENHGVDRQAATREDQQTRRWFATKAQEFGCSVKVDGIGNMFALLDWTPGAPYVLIGSHLDSQPLAGRFDGAYGVLAALHAAKELNEQVRAIQVLGGRPPKFNLAVANWFNEEGSRFAPSIMGSSVFAGLMDEKQMLDVKDSQGITVHDALDAIGFLGHDERPEVASYAEIHIEQGRILEREGISLGAVDRSWYTQKLEIEVLGEQSHTGATAMADRHDALTAAAKIILMVEAVTHDYDEEALVSSIGQMFVEPNSPIVVARRVKLVADLRSDSKDIVQGARATLLEKISALAIEHDIHINVRDFDIRPHRYYPEDGLILAEKVAADLGISIRRIQTMAGHDSVAINTIAPTVMMFIPSVDGVSHCEREFTKDEDMLTGLRALTEVARHLVEGALHD
ncbi:Zn-dependent hydrolase [Arthrobacter sp. MYb23]|uniref:M20 family metallo-hydrolase n=1 Tax=unclassified Arthrobacter TaxID=235627 RepID=UPI000CFDF50C|nr:MULTISPECIES: M20 family metallo-hydrolase [unclassified Arthrobacter]PRB34164.1 Zn-dependent hydrolase [Arthrobacter sp. MYb51]PRB88620.1 Zn-dependent hydrolase [Arthrobacter sp. MYb23]